MQDRTLLLLLAGGAISIALAASNPDAGATEWIEGFAILASVAIVVRGRPCAG
jgi:hypothetical protein